MSPVKTEGLRFECTQCGGCCTNRGEYTHVYVSADEIRGLARLLDMSVVYVYLIVLGVTGFLIDYSLIWLRRKLCPWFGR